MLPITKLAVLWASWQAVQCVKRQQADLLVTDSPQATFWCAMFASWLNVRVYHLAWSFYLPLLPHGIVAIFGQLLYANVHKFVVHSRLERQLYSDYFGLPPSRFEVRYWGSPTPPVQPHDPLIPGEYVCVMGDRPLDVRTLMAAIATLPDIPVVIVAPPGHRITVPLDSQIIVRHETSRSRRMNLLRHARFLVMPMRQTQGPGDYQTLVAAMQLGKTVILPDVPNLRDYAFHNSNALFYQPADPGSLAIAIRELWNNVVKCEILATNGKDFAEKFCSQDTRLHDFQQLLFQRGL